MPYCDKWCGVRVIYFDKYICIWYNKRDSFCSCPAGEGVSQPRQTAEKNAQMGAAE